MRRVIPITEQLQRYLENMKESFWGDLYGQTRTFWKWTTFGADAGRLPAL
jgi:hypothetical protein